MSASPRTFRFKQFVVQHEYAAHKVGTDGVLLGAWADVNGANQILDIGTGSGLVVLMLAQRTALAARIDGVEVHAPSAEEALFNASRSPWPEKVIIHQCRIQDFQSAKPYDLIVSNPPYFVDSLKAPDAARSAARHTAGLSFEELLQSVDRLLSAEGKFCLILPTAEGDRWAMLARQQGWFCHRQMAFFSRQEKPQERWLQEWKRYPGEQREAYLCLYDQADQWSDAYHQLAGPFYLERKTPIKG